MRCASPQVVWAFPDSTGATLVEVEVLALAPAGTACATSQYVVLDQAEVDHYLVSPFKLTLEEAGMVSLAVAGVWMVGWVFRVLIGMLRERTDTSVEE